MEMDMLFNSGILTEERPGAIKPPQELWEKKANGLVIIECPQRIPCNPCHTSCPTGAVMPFEDINDTPKIDYAKCTGCAMCTEVCPHQVFELAGKRVHIVNRDACMECGACQRNCPTGALKNSR